MKPYRRIAGSLVALYLGTGMALAAPLKMGIIDTLSGPQSSTGQLYRNAMRFVVDHINSNGGWNGEPVQLLEYDNQGGPAGAADKLKAAISDGVQIVGQGASSAISAQISEDVRKFNMRNPGKEIVFINMGGDALELTGEKCHFHHFRVSGNAPVKVKAMVLSMKEEGVLGTKVYSINQNYSWGQDMEQAIVDAAAFGGYTVVEKTLHDTNKIQDFSPYVAKIAASKAETVMTGNWSNDLLLLMKASKAAGLKVRFGAVFLDQPGNIANAGEVALGHYIAHTFNAEHASPETEKFVKDFTAKMGHFPQFIEPQGSWGMMLVAEALKQVKAESGKLNVNTLAKTLENTKIKSPLGEMSMRAADHQAQLPFAVSVVSKAAKYKQDGTDMGFKLVKVYRAEEIVSPVQATCKMQRPN